jgi:hypothetical protein
MNADAKINGEPIRLVFELARADHPRLYDDLIQFPKGTKRINRLRVLAYDGLLIQSGKIVPVAASHQGGDQQREDGGRGGEITNDLFGPSIAD